MASGLSRRASVRGEALRSVAGALRERPMPSARAVSATVSPAKKQVRPRAGGDRIPDQAIHVSINPQHSRW
jgi:hypothetical protein